jgi:hypothetical protein
MDLRGGTCGFILLAVVCGGAACVDLRAGEQDRVPDATTAISLARDPTNVYVT